MPALRAVSPGTRIVVDSVDLHYRRMARAAALTGHGAGLAEADAVHVRELALYGSADVVLAVSEEEQDILCELLPGTPVGILPNVHRPLGDRAIARRAQRRPVRGLVRPRAERRRGALPVQRCCRRSAGSGASCPSRSRAPACLSSSPTTRAIAGRRGHRVPAVGDGRARPAALSIAPLRYGAGLKGKVGESLAAGVPVVGTSVAAEGFPAPGEAMLVADDAAGLAAAMVRLAGDDALWQALSDGGRAQIARWFGPERCDRELADVLEYLDPVTKAE